YHRPHRILFSVYERGQALAAAILQFGGRVVATLGRAVAAFHATPLHVATRITPQAVLDDLRSRIARGDDRVRAVGSLSGLVDRFERATLLRKIHSLLTDTTRHPEPEALRRRQGEAVRLLWTGT